MTNHGQNIDMIPTPIAATTTRPQSEAVAGAAAVQVGTANFVDPFIWSRLLDGLRSYMSRHNLSRLTDLTGTLDATSRQQAWISS